MKKIMFLGILVLASSANAGIFSRDKNKIGCENSIENLHTAIERNLIARAYNLGITDQYIVSLKNQIAIIENDPIAKRLSSKSLQSLKDKLEESNRSRSNDKVEALTTLDFIKEQEKVVMQECYDKESTGTNFSMSLFDNPLEK